MIKSSSDFPVLYIMDSTESTHLHVIVSDILRDLETGIANTGRHVFYYLMGLYSIPHLNQREDSYFLAIQKLDPILFLETVDDPLVLTSHRRKFVP